MSRVAASRSVDRIDTDMDTDTERTPLLAGTPTPTANTAVAKGTFQGSPTSQENVSPDYGSYNGHNDSATGPDPLAHLRDVLRPRVLFLALLGVFLVELGVAMMIPPMNAIMESIICRQKHPEIFLPPSASPSIGESFHGTAGTWIRQITGGIFLTDDPVCKYPDVQGYLAMLKGWAAAFDCIPGIVGAVPYGILSDRWGRKGVLAISMLGIWLSQAFIPVVFSFSEVMPLWTIWFASAFQLIGGGGAVATAMIYTLIADVVSVESRASAFLQVGAVFLTAQMIGGPLAGLMMVWNPWIPLLVAVAILILANFIALVIPETLGVHGQQTTPRPESENGDGISKRHKLWHKARSALAETWAFVIGNQRVAFLMLSLVFVVLGRFVSDLLLQYATDRYGWTWSKASMILSIGTAGSLVTLMVLLPGTSWLCIHRFGMPGVSTDLWLSRWSGVVQILGCLIIAAAGNGVFFSFGLIWFALGSGMSMLIRSLITALVEEHHVGTANTLVGFMEMVGLTVAGPLLAKSLSVGLDLGGPWVGLPFLTGGSFFATSTIILWVFRLPNTRGSAAEPS